MVRVKFINKIFFVFLLLFFINQTASANLNAQETKAIDPEKQRKYDQAYSELCDDWLPTDNIVFPKSQMSFFFRALPGSSQISYAAYGNMLTVLDLKTGEEKYLQGNASTTQALYDLVPLNSRVASYVEQDKNFKYHLRFLDLRDLKKIPSGSRAIPNPIKMKQELKMNGVYQSSAKISETSAQEKYRIINDANTLSMAEITVSKGDPPVVQVSNSPKRLCPGLDIKLPILSPDGNMIAGRIPSQDPNVNAVTKIWKISKDGACQEIQSLGMSTGKVSFSPDLTSVVFHTNENFQTMGTNHQYFGKYDGKATSIVQFNLQDKTLKELATVQANQSLYYPHYTKDGKILVAITQKKDKTWYTGFFEINESKLHSKPISVKDLKSQKFEDIRSLVSVRNNICQTSMSQDQSVTVATSNFDGADCYHLRNFLESSIPFLSEGSEEYKDVPKILSKIDSECKDRGSRIYVGNGIFRKYPEATEVIKKQNPLELMKNRCTLCHFGGSQKPPSLDKMLERAKTDRGYLDKIILRVENNEMPMEGTPLSEAEKLALSRYLKDHFEYK